MNASETQFNRDDVIAELDAQIRHATRALKGRRRSVRRSLMDWISSLEDTRTSVMEGTTTEAQVRALVHQGCRSAGAIPSRIVRHDGDVPVWITTGEARSSSVAIIPRLGRLLRTEMNGAHMSPWGRINRRSVGRRN